jgi:hypothetical protein
MFAVDLSAAVGLKASLNENEVELIGTDSTIRESEYEAINRLSNDAQRKRGRFDYWCWRRQSS